MWRPVRLFLMFTVAASLGLFLAYRERNNRDQAVAAADGAPTPAATAEPDPAPAPEAKAKPADPKPVTAAREQPRRAEPAPVRVEPRPDPRADETTLTRRKAYAKIITEFEKAETAAERAFGRRPKPTDPAGFTVPYKAYLDDKKQQARQKLRTDLGLTDGEIDQIKKEGDKARWPTR